MEQKIDTKTLEEIIGKIKSGDLADKKISIYSHRAMTLLRYMQLSTPGLTRSDAAKLKLFEIIPEYHKDIWDQIITEIPIKDNTNGIWTGKKTWLKRPNKPLLREAFDEIGSTQDKIIMVYSPQIATLFKYLMTTVIRFKTSTHGAEMLEKILEKQFPKLWSEINELVEN